MTDTPSPRIRIHNHRDQPVELHLDGETVILPPFGGLEFDGRAAGSPQVQTLARQRMLSVESLPEPASDPAAAGRKRAARKPKPKPKSKKPKTAAPKPTKPTARKKSP